MSNLERTPTVSAIAREIYERGIRLNANTNSHYVSFFMISSGDQVEQITEFLNVIIRAAINEDCFKLEKKRVLSEIGLSDNRRLKPYLFQYATALCFGRNPFDIPIGGIRQSLKEQPFRRCRSMIISLKINLRIFL